MAIDFSRKRAGILIPVFAMRRPGDLGIGDTCCVKDAVDFCRSVGATVLQLLPVNQTGGDNSPYNAISSVALEFAYLTLEPAQVPGLSPSDLDAVVPEAVRRTLAEGPVRYREVKPLKLAVLERAFERFRAEGPAPERRELEQFVSANREWLPDYALFSVLLEEHGHDARWTLWKPEHRNPVSAADWIRRSGRRGALQRRVEFHQYVQWLCFRQWTGVSRYAAAQGVQLMGDIPFGISRFSADVWARQDLFDLEWSGGAPPEKFFKTDPFTEKWGQNWGIPLYRWDVHRKQDYAWWRQRIVKTCEVFHLFRIDHVLGFFRIYAFPWTPERNGEFTDLTEEQAAEICDGRLPGFMPHADEPEDLAAENAETGTDLLRMILRFAGTSGVVAEDLGVVPEYVPGVLETLGIPGFAIPIFCRDKKHEFLPVSAHKAAALATYATHDHPPLRAWYEDLVKWWTGPDGHDGWLEVCRVMRLAGLNDKHPPTAYTDELHQALMRTIMGSPCWLVVYMMTDILATTQRFNVPGTAGDENWSARIDRPLAAFLDDPHFAPKLDLFRQETAASGRA